MIKERLQELLDFVKTESPNKLANKGWINDDIYLKFGVSPTPDILKREFAKIDLFWTPINKKISSFIAIIFLLSTIVFLMVSLSHGKLNLNIFNPSLIKGISNPVSLTSNNYFLEQTLEEKELKDQDSSSTVVIEKIDESIYQENLEDQTNIDMKNDLKDAAKTDLSQNQEKENNNQIKTVKRKSNLF